MPFSIAGPSSPAIPSLDGINRVAQRISSGINVDYRSNTAEAAIAGRLDTSLGETTVAIKNVTDQISSLQKADDTLGYVASLVERAQAFDVQAGNGALSEADQEVIQRSQTDLLQEAQSTLANASFNNQPLFESDAGKALQDRLSQAASAPAADRAELLSAASEEVSSLRAGIGAEQNGLEAQTNQLFSQFETDSQRLSSIQDTDFAEEITNLIKEELQFKASVEVFNTQRLAEKSVLSLLS